MSIVLTSKDKKILYSRYHSLKAQAKKKGLKFYWEDMEGDPKGVERFYHDVAEIAPTDYNPETHTVRFNSKVVELSGYCPAGMVIRPFSSAVKERRQIRKRDRLRLSYGEEVHILSLATAYLCMSLLENEGDVDVLVEQAFLDATTGD